MPTQFDLTGFSFQFDENTGTVSNILAADLTILGSDDLGVTFFHDPDPADPGDLTGNFDPTSGLLYGLQLGGVTVDLSSSQWDGGMGRATLNGDTTDFLFIENDILDRTFLFHMDGVAPFNGLPTEVELGSFMTSANLGPIPAGPFADGTEWSPGDAAVATETQFDPFNGTDGPDTLIGFHTPDEIDGKADNDLIDGRGGNDTLLGGLGDDVIIGGPGNDLIEGGDGADQIDARYGIDVIRASVGEVDGDVINGFDFGDQMVITNLGTSTVMQTGAGSFFVDSNNNDSQDEGEAAFNIVPVIPVNLIQLPLAGQGPGGTTTIMLDPDGMPDLGIGQRLDGPQDNGMIGDFLFANPAQAPGDFEFIGAQEAIRLLPDGHQINEISDEIPSQVVGINRGIFLTTGGGPGTGQTSTSYSVNLGEPGDPVLTDTARAAFPGAGGTEDAAILNFTVDAEAVGSTPSISFDLFFGSDEYPEFVNSPFVDIASVYVNGVNYALFNNDPNQPLSITGDSINTPGNFYDNNGDDGSDNDPFTGTFDTEYDGFSVLLNVIAPLQVGQNEITIAIADTGDHILDSGIFIGNVKGSNIEASGNFVKVQGTSADDEIETNAAPELIELGGGKDIVKGTPQQLNGDIINGWADGDTLQFQGTQFTMDDLTVTLGSAILDVDTDGDGNADTTTTLQGDFTNATFSVTNEGGDTLLSTEGAVTPGINESGGPGPDTMVGTAGNDTLHGGGGDDVIAGMDGDDDLRGGAGNDQISGSDGDDTIDGGDGDDNIGGGLGDDDIEGGLGGDTIGAGQGNDEVDGDEGDDGVFGGAGNDTLNGNEGNDTMGAGFNDDIVNGGAGDDLMGGGTGRDTMDGGDGNDSLGGGEGNDTVMGGDGDDNVNGGGRHDMVDGGAGDDQVNGGAGNDTMTGGAGNDLFIFNEFEDGATDIITDWTNGEDMFRMIGVDNAPGTGLAGKVAALGATQVGDDVEMNYGGNTIILENALVGDIGVEDFQFI